MSEQVDRLAAWFTAARAAWNWTQDAVRERGGPSPATQRRIENGRQRTINAGTRRDYAAAFGLSEDQLLDIEAGRDVPIPQRPPRKATHDAPDGGIRSEVNELRERVARLEALVVTLRDEWRASQR